ncbi:MAG TPA: hypothetical protein VGN20_06745 [Mucilaginibacter sp.]|jgi:hypothetical protein
MKRMILFFFLFVPFVVRTQPGYVIVTKNINDFSPKEIEKSKAFNYSYYRCTYIIDATSDLSKLNNLQSLRQVDLIVSLDSLPKELYFLSDSLKEITIDGGNKLTKISSLGSLKNLESISIRHFAGTDLPELNQLTKLKSLSIWGDYYNDENKLKHINEITNCKSLRNLEIRYVSLDTLDLDMSRMNIESLAISSRFLKNIDAISGSKSLKHLQLYWAQIEKLPRKMGNMENLESIDFAYMDRLKNISNLKKMKNLHMLFIRDACNLSEIPKSFNTNLNIENIRIELRQNNSFVAEGLTQLKKLKSLSLEYLPQTFLLPKNFTTCENLENVVFIQVGANSLRNQITIKTLPKLKKLTL